MKHPMKEGTFTVSSGFGPRWGTHHNGIDFAAPLGTPIYAPADGVVIEGKDRAQGSVSGFGSWVWLDCQKSEGLDFIFGHVDHGRIMVRRGDRVKAGQLIAHVGNEGQSTGPHLHFECWTAPGRQGGRAVDPAPILANRVGRDTAPAVEVRGGKPKITDIHMKFGFGYQRSTRDIQAIFIHTTENSFASAAINVGLWQAGGKSTGNTALGSYHVLVDRTELVLCNTDGWVAYGTGNKGNQVGLQISFVAQARSTRDQWLAEERNHGTLSRGAWQVAQWCTRHNIPATYIDGAQLRQGKRGISTHNDARLAWGVTDHTDPGPGFPIDVFVQLVKAHMEGPKPAPKPAPAPKPVVPAPAPPAPPLPPPPPAEGPALSLDTPVTSAVEGSDFVAPLGDFIRYADANAFEAKNNTIRLLELVEQLDGRIAAIETRLAPNTEGEERA